MKATPEQWHELERHSHSSQPWAPCILELRARVEVLEDAARKPAPNDRQIRSSLVQRVMGVLGHYGPGTARAAIREVAEWLREEGYPSSPSRLEREVEQ